MVVRHLLVVALGGLALLGCVDGPFARVNLFDPGSPVDVQLVTSRDTVTAAETDVAVFVVTNPVVVGYEPEWSSSFAGLVHIGNGVFRLNAPSTVTAPVTLTARFLEREFTVTVYRAPVP